MEEKEVRSLFTDILSATLNEVKDTGSIREKLTSDNLISVYKLSKKHDLAHVVYNFIVRNELKVDERILKLYEREELTAVYRCEQIKYTFDEVCSVLDASEISYIPLKGAVLREHYPYESMRTSCDIDVLVRADALERAISALEGKGYSCVSRNYHDVSLLSPGNVHLELHFSLRENTPKMDAVLDEVWEHAVGVEGSRHVLTEEFFVFYAFAHMAYHFVSGGCGIRSLLDIWIMERRMGLSYICGKNLLERAELYRFAEEMSDISNKYLGGGEANDFSELVMKYVFNGGVYGNRENMVAVGKSKAKTTSTYVFRRLFLPYGEMSVSYPILKKIPVLLPFCWLHRLVNAVFVGKTKKAMSEFAAANNITDAQIDEIKGICEKLGL